MNRVALATWFTFVAFPGNRMIAQACQPDSLARGHRARVERDIHAHSGDPVHLFRLAVDQVALCQDDDAFQTLDRMADLPGGLDPSNYRGFARVRGALRFLQVVAKIRAANPPIIRSTVAYSILQTDLFPEGMAFDSATGRVIAGSSRDCDIIWTDSTGAIHYLADKEQGGLGALQGLHVDGRRHHLWAVSTGPRTPQCPDGVRGLFQFDLTTGRLLARYRLSDTASYTLDDVVVDPVTGAAYTTHTAAGNVYVARPGDTTLHEFTSRGLIPQANGITIGPSGRFLVVAGGLGLSRVDLRDGRVTELPRSPGVVDVTIDGLYRHGRSLIGIQNGVHPGRVLQLDLDSAETAVIHSEVIEAYNPLVDHPTTGAVSGDVLYMMANPQGRRTPPSPADSVGVSPILILRVSLSR